jgi:hypothetical protein
VDWRPANSRKSAEFSPACLAKVNDECVCRRKVDSIRFDVALFQIKRRNNIETGLFKA